MMARGATLHIGKGTSAFIKNLCPTREFTQRILNPALHQHLTDLVMVRRGNITRGGLTMR